jgi:DMSO/TMAO reductase YedYZ molybdopterin-dependent catalytic subunit
VDRHEHRRREEVARAAGRLPPGQALTEKWPVFTAAGPPQFDPVTWRFQVTGLVDQPLSFTYDEFLALPQVEAVSDIHCVTRWSRFDNTWEGIAFRTVAELARPKPEAKFVLFKCMAPYSSNIPLEACMDEGVLFAHSHDGVPLLPQHGWPLRLVVPQLYFWKSAKWVNRVEFLAQDQLGFWEKLGYHNEGDPWKQQRRALNLALRIPKRFRRR